MRFDNIMFDLHKLRTHNPDLIANWFLTVNVVVVLWRSLRCSLSCSVRWPISCLSIVRVVRLLSNWITAGEAIVWWSRITAAAILTVVIRTERWAPNWPLFWPLKSSNSDWKLVNCWIYYVVWWFRYANCNEIEILLDKTCQMICNKISLTLHYLVVSRNCQVDEDELCLLSEKDWDFSLELDSSKLVGRSSAS